MKMGADDEFVHGTQYFGSGDNGEEANEGVSDSYHNGMLHAYGNWSSEVENNEIPQMPGTSHLAGESIDGYANFLKRKLEDFHTELHSINTGEFEEKYPDGTEHITDMELELKEILGDDEYETFVNDIYEPFTYSFIYS